MQYRMLKEICDVHAPIFYPYKIITARNPRLSSRDRRFFGLWIERVPPSRGVQTLLDYEVHRGLEIANMIHIRKPKHPDGSPYTVCILSPYTLSIRRFRQAAAERKYDWLKLSTITAIQGFESDAVIVTTSRHRTVDMCKDPSVFNVATSRARDILVLLLASGMALDTYCTDPSSRIRRLRPLTHFTCHAKRFTKSDAVLGNIQVEAKRRLRNMKAELEHRPTSRFDTGRNKFQDFARDVLSDEKYKVWPLPRHLRVQVCRYLCLKNTFKQNKDVHMALYHGMMTCGRDTFHACLGLFEAIYDYPKRNRSLLEKMGIRYYHGDARRVDQVSPRVVEDIRALYTPRARARR